MDIESADSTGGSFKPEDNSSEHASSVQADEEKLSRDEETLLQQIKQMPEEEVKRFLEGLAEEDRERIQKLVDDEQLNLDVSTENNDTESGRYEVEQQIEEAGEEESVSFPSNLNELLKRKGVEPSDQNKWIFKKLWTIQDKKKRDQAKEQIGEELSNYGVVNKIFGLVNDEKQ